MSQFGTPGQIGNIGHTNVFGRPEGSGARNRNERLCLIVNPMAGAGSAGRSLDALKRAADLAFENWEVRLTEGPGHATELARQASEEPFQLIAAVGGDGTCHEVVNGMVSSDRPRNRKQAFTVIPFGTGSDLMKTLEVPRKLSGALWIAATGMSLPTDVGKATVSAADGAQREHYFINVAGFGANGEVVRRVNARSKKVGGRLAFMRTALEAALSYKPAQVHVRWLRSDGERGSWQGDLTSTFIANGAYCGGGMWVGRGGTMHDGLLDMTIIPSTGALQQLADVRRLYDGRIERAKDATCAAVTELEVTTRPGRDVYIDLDGELSGQLPARFEVISRALHVRGGWINNPLASSRK
ncbi:MAG: diacylglycerol kinase (ATP) [Myxococcota bacterium]|jgi:diacylglycerol kinase (ATP)